MPKAWNFCLKPLGEVMVKKLIGTAVMVVALALGGASGSALAADPSAKAGEKKINCETTVDNNDLLICAKRDLDLAQKRLDGLVKQGMATLPVKARPVFENAQRAWVAYRDADCQWNAYEIESGNSSELIQATCLADLTAARVEELEAGLGGTP